MLMPSHFPIVPLLVRMILATMTVTALPRGRLQLCGSELANKLAEICSVHGYNDPFRHGLHFKASNFERGILMRSRSKRGVADECCKTGCSWDTLEQYCNPTLSPPNRPQSLQEAEDHAINHIPQDDSAGSSQSVASSSEGRRRPTSTRDQKNDLVSKVRGHHDKKGRRGNNRCRCRRRRRRGKGDIEDLERYQNKIAPVIGTINPSYLGIPVILPPRIRKEGSIALQDVNRKE